MRALLSGSLFFEFSRSQIFKNLHNSARMRIFKDLRLRKREKSDPLNSARIVTQITVRALLEIYLYIIKLYNLIIES